MVQPDHVIVVIVGNFDGGVVRVSQSMGLKVAVHDAVGMVGRMARMRVGGGKPPPKRQDRREDDPSRGALNCPQDSAIMAAAAKPVKSWPSDHGLLISRVAEPTAVGFNRAYSPGSGPASGGAASPSWSF